MNKLEKVVDGMQEESLKLAKELSDEVVSIVVQKFGDTVSVKNIIEVVEEVVHMNRARILIGDQGLLVLTGVHAKLAMLVVAMMHNLPIEWFKIEAFVGKTIAITNEGKWEVVAYSAEIDPVLNDLIVN